MRKTRILCTAFAVCFYIFLSGCGSSSKFSAFTPTPPTVPLKPGTVKNPADLIGLEDEIKQAYLEETNRQFDWNLTIDNVWVEKFCGVYNGYAAVLMFNTYISPMEGVWLSSELEVVIDGVSFFYVPITGAEITLYKDSTFYGLREAYEDGLLTRDDLNSIAYYQNEGMVFPERASKRPAGGKIIWDGDINREFDDRTIVMVMDKNYTDWRFYASDFKGVDVVRVYSVTVLRLKPPGLGINRDDWRDILDIEIANPGKQNVINAIRELEKLPFIEYAGPNYFFYYAPPLIQYE